MDITKMPDGGKYDLCSYATTPINSQMNNTTNAYAKFYEGIERANQAITGLRTYGNVSSNSELAQLLGEALTLRAVIYLDLIKGWGDVPARFEPITTNTMYLGRTDRDVIYKQLLSDLEEAQHLVAWPNATSVTQSVERVNKAFVKALRARIALYAGGYSQRADGIRLSNDPELERNKMYALAQKECTDIITQRCNQLGSFKENFLNLCKDIVKAGNESIWEIPFSDGRGRVLYTFGVKHNEKDQYTGQAQGGVNGPLPTLFYDYDVDDIRRDITCVPYEWSKRNESKTTIAKSQQMVFW
ncbi:RagB/SusD domain-containing protein [gut metagenome]|uniref:RagB/SusD domain-containing protein n=1 Tax=gut metagenome TaxID=749906 RepID=J9GBJ2_9ZZZZ